MRWIVVFLIGCAHAYIPCRLRTDSEDFTHADCSNRAIQRLSTVSRVSARFGEYSVSVLTSQVRSLDLSGNNIVELPSLVFAAMRHPEMLLSLNLSNNGVLEIASSTFAGLVNLRQLDLSGNNIVNVNRTIFSELKSLEYLNLNDNNISTVPEKTLHYLPKLKHLSLRSSMLSCDCQLVDLIKHIEAHSIHVTPVSQCVYPLSLRRHPLAALKPKQLRRSCGKGDLESQMRVHPASTTMIAYPGEEAVIECSIEEGVVEWIRDDVPVVESGGSSPRVALETTDDGRRVVLKIRSVLFSDEGEWTCHGERDEHTHRMTVRLAPLASAATTCMQEWTHDERGSLLWPTGKVGVRCKLACPFGTNFAYRICSRDGWSSVDSTRCPVSSPFVIKTLTLLHSQWKQQFIPTARELIPQVSTVFETRLVSRLIANSTAQHATAAIAQALTLPTASYLDSSALLRVLSLDHHADGTDTDDLAACHKSLYKRDPLTGFIFTKTSGRQMMCTEQKNLNMIKPSPAAAIGLSAQLLNTFNHMPHLKLYWFHNQTLFRQGLTLDGRFVSSGEVLGVSIKTVPARKSKNVVKNAMYFNFVMDQAVDGSEKLAQWSSTISPEKSVWQWKSIHSSICSHTLSIKHRNAILFTCDWRILLDDDIAYFAVLRNSSFEKNNSLHFVLPPWVLICNGFLSLFLLIFCIFLLYSHISSSAHSHCNVNISCLLLIFVVTFTIGIDSSHSVICQSVSSLLHFIIVALHFWVFMYTRSFTIFRHSKIVDHRLNRLRELNVTVGMYIASYGIAAIAVTVSYSLHGTHSTQFCLPERVSFLSVFEITLLLPLIIAVLLIIGYTYKLIFSRSLQVASAALICVYVESGVWGVYESNLPLLLLHSAAGFSIALLILTHVIPQQPEKEEFSACEYLCDSRLLSPQQPQQRIESVYSGRVCVSGGSSVSERQQRAARRFYRQERARRAADQEVTTFHHKQNPPTITEDSEEEDASVDVFPAPSVQALVS